MQCLFFGAVISLAGITSPAADRSVVTNAVARPPQAVKPGESFGTDKSDAEKQAALQRIVRERCEIRRNMLNGPNPQIAKAQIPDAISEVNRRESEILGVVPRLRIGCNEATLNSLLAVGRTSKPLKLPLETTGGLLVLSDFGVGDGSMIRFTFELDRRGIVVGWMAKTPP